MIIKNIVGGLKRKKLNKGNYFKFFIGWVK